MQFTIQQIWSLEQARCRFGKYLRVAVNGRAPDVARLIQEFPAQREMSEQGELVRGLGVRLQLRRAVEGAVASDKDDSSERIDGAEAVLALGEEARFYPSDAALAGWRAQADRGQAAIAYD
jgi:DNA polymerase-3 subunit alpha